MKAIDLSRSLNYLDDEIIAEAMAVRNLKNAKTARTSPVLVRFIAAASCAAVIAAVILFGICGSKNMPVLPPDSGDITVSPDITDTRPTAPTTANPPITAVTDTTVSDTPTEPYTTPDESHGIGGGDFTFELRYIQETENLYIAGQILGNEAVDEWVNNVYLKMTSEEQSELPALYRIIHDLDIPKEDFIEENKKLADFPGMYFSEEIIEALYLDDVNEMVRRLVNPTALYYDGEIYTFDGLRRSPELTDNIPDEVLEEYLDFIYDTAVQVGQIKYMQEDINSLKNYTD